MKLSLSISNAIIYNLIVNANSLVSKHTAFIRNLAISKFCMCSLFFVGEYSDINDKNCPTFESTLSQIATELEPFLIPYRIEKYPFSSSYKEKLVYPRSSLNCKLVIVVTTSQSDSFLTEIDKTFSPPYIPILRKDKDYWIFLTQSTNLDGMLLSKSLPSRVKYKIGVGIKPGGQISLKTVCFFCGLNASPSLIELDNVNQKSLNSNQFPSENLFPDFVKNLNGKLLTISTPAIWAFLDFNPSIAVGNAKRGLMKPLLHEYLMEKFNFTYKIVLSIGIDGGPGGGTGFQLPNGTWIGVVGDVLSGRADLGVLTARTPSRVKLVTFTNAHVFISYLHFVTTTGQPIYSPKALVWPFRSLLWLCILLSTLLAFAVFKLITFLSRAIGVESGSFARRGVASKTDQWGIRHQIFFVTTSFLDQDCVLPISAPLRCFVAFWLFFVLIVTTLYRAKLVLSLAFPLTDLIPETFDQLANSKYQVGFFKEGDAAYNLLKNSRDAVYSTLFNKMEVITGKGLNCYQNVLKQPRHSCIAYEMSTHFLTAKNLSESEARKLVISQDSTFTVFIGMVMQSGSIYTDAFNRRLTWAIPFHLSEIWKQRDLYETAHIPKRQWWLETNQTDRLVKTDGSGNSDLTLKHISGAFYGLVLLLLISSFAFILELLFRQFPCSWRLKY